MDEINGHKLLYENDIQTIHVDKYLSETNSILNLSLKTYKDILIDAPMKIGKTHYVIEGAHEYCKSLGWRLIVVVPTVSLGQEYVKRMSKKGEVIFSKAGLVKEIPQDCVYLVTTHESLYKLTSQIEKRGEGYGLVVDEAHTIYSNYNFRKALAEPLKHLDKYLCKFVLSLTATSDNFLPCRKFDCVYRVIPKERFMQAQNLYVVSDLGEPTTEEISNFLLELYLRDPETPNIVRLNNKKEIESVKKALRSVKGFDGEVKVMYRGDSQQIGKEAVEKMEKTLLGIMNGTEEFKGIYLTTCLIDVGIEIMTDKKPNIVTFANYGTTPIEITQFIGRFRNGSGDVYTFVQGKGEGYKKLRSYTEIIWDMGQYLGDQYSLITNHSKIDDLPFKHEFIRRNKISGFLYEYSIDWILFYNACFGQYSRELYNHPDALLKFFKNHATLNIPNIEKKNLRNCLMKNEDIHEKIKEIAEKRKNEAEVKKEIAKEIYEYVQVATDEMLHEFIKKPSKFTNEEKDSMILATVRWEEWHSQLFINERRDMYEVWEICLQAKDFLRVAMMISLDGRVKIIKELKDYARLNLRYENGSQLKKEDFYYFSEKDYNSVKRIRDSIKELFGKEIKVRMGETNAKKIKEYLQVEYKIKISEKNLEKKLNKIYNLDKENRITSLKTDKNILKVIEEWTK